MEISENSRAVAEELKRTWGGKPTVFRHVDESESNAIFIASRDDERFENIVVVGTIGLSDHDLGMGPVRVELVGAFDRSFEGAPNVAATCGFNAIKDGWEMRPESVHPGVVRMYCTSTTVPHILLIDPFFWGSGPNTVQMPDFSIAWLMMMPISDAELAFMEEHGASALSSKLEEQRADLGDLFRSSVV